MSEAARGLHTRRYAAALPAGRGTYALLLELASPVELRVGALGIVRFDAPVYLYAGSAFGPGGLAARVAHHLAPAPRPHWHIDFLRGAARVVALWTTRDARRLECRWSEAARGLRGARAVAGFGASDCDCPSHLAALPRWPQRRAFRRQLARWGLAPPCAPIRSVSRS